MIAPMDEMVARRRIERLQQWMSVWATREHRETVDALAAALERAEQERDEWREMHDEEVAVRGLAEQQLAGAQEALAAIASLDPDWTHRDQDSVYGIARVALAVPAQAAKDTE